MTSIKQMTTWRVAGNLRYYPNFTGSHEYQASPGAWNITLRLDDLPAGSPGPEIEVNAYSTYFSVADEENPVYSIEAQVERLIRDAHGNAEGYSEIEYDERDGYAVFDPDVALDKAGWLAREYGTHLAWSWDGSREGLRP